MFKHIKETIKPIGVKSGNLSAGVGYVYIPEDVDRDEFVEDCLRSHTISLHGGMHHGVFYDIAVDRSVIQRINFPKETGKFGSPVVWVNIPIFNKPAVIGVLKYDDEYYYNEENGRSVSLESEGKHIDVSALSTDAKIELSIIGNSVSPGELSLNIINENGDGTIDVNVQGDVTIHSSNTITLISDNIIEFKVIDEDDETLFSMKYTNGEGFYYEDEFGNEYTINDDKINIKHNDGIVIEINKNGISLGSDNSSSEPILLGDKSVKSSQDIIDKLVSVIDALDAFCKAQLSVTSSITLFSPLAPGYTALQAALLIIKPLLLTIKNVDLPKTKSTKVTSD